jgi:hypothetical protein
MRHTRNPQIIGGSVSSAGTALSGAGFTIQKGAAGVYTILFERGFRPVSVVASSAINATNRSSDVALVAGSWVVTMFVGTTGAAIDAPFTFVAVGA